MLEGDPVAEGASQHDLDPRRAGPLPDPLPMGERDGDPLLEAWRRVVEADGAGAASERSAARLALADAWLDIGGIGPALELVREVERIAPDHPAVLERRAWLLPRTAHQRDAAHHLVALARRRPSLSVWEAAVNAWVRADDLGEAATCVEALQRLVPTEPRGAALALGVARLRSGARRGAALVNQLIERANQARHRDERDLWRALSLDAWLESHGALGGDSLAEALAATGHPRAAVYVAIESAARALLDPPNDAAAAMALLMRAAHLAESSGMPGEATAVWTLAALLPDGRAREAREALRDLLAERGRVLDLSVRLRADARRAPPGARAAAWKGVAAVEMPVAPALSAQALLRALAEQPEDHEAFDLLRALASDPVAAESIRDGLWTLTRSPLPRAMRTRALLWLGELEEAVGDVASADAAWAAIDEPLSAAFEGLARVHARAEELVDRAEEALAAVAGASPDAQRLAIEQLLSTLGATPGAFRDLKAVTRLLGPHAAGDGRVARLWMQIAVRQGDGSQRLAVARRVATRCADHAVRQRAVFEYVDAIDRDGGDVGEVTELVALLLDERSDDAILATTLAALAEHTDDTVLAQDAITALARATADPWERDVLARFTRVCSGMFEVFAGCLAEPSASAERSAQLARLHDLVGDSAQLLALRTRALLAQSGPAEEGIAVARRFAAYDPLSAEAAIAWFGAASLAGDVAQVAQAATALTASLATLRDIAAVTRAAMSRLAALDALPRAGEIALNAANCGALADRGLRAAVAELASRLDPSVSARLLEAVDVAADGAGERATVLRALAGCYRTLGNAGAELGAWQRAATLGHPEALTNLLRLAPRVGDRGWNAQLLSQQLDATLEPRARRRLLLAIAAEHAEARPPRPVDAMAALDRLAMEQQDQEVRELVVRAMLSIAQPDAAIGRLTRWAAEQPEPGAVSSLLLRAARLAHEGLGDPSRALVLLRGLLRRDPGRVEALELAEEIAARSGVTEPVLAIYAELLDRAAGPHGRRAIEYRRAVFHERIGAEDAALRAFLALFEAQPSLGAPLSAVERLAPRLGRHDVLLGALDRLAHEAPHGAARARILLRAAALARGPIGDEVAALDREVLAHQADASEHTVDALRASARALGSRDPATAQRVFDLLVDEQLALGNQCWDDDARRAHAEKAIEVGVSDGADPYRVAAAVGLFLRQHPDPAAGREAVRALVARSGASEAMRAAALDAPAMRVASAPSAPPAAPEPPRAESNAVPPADDARAPSDAEGGEAPELQVEPLPTTASAPPDVPDPRVSVSIPPRASAPDLHDATLAALRSAASHGNDAAASVLASRLSATDDLRDEALAIQRRRFNEDPSRLDALEAMIALHRALRRTGEMAALTQLLIALEGRDETVMPPELTDIGEAPEGVARVLLPARLGPYPELGALLWETIGSVARRGRDRARDSDARLVSPASVLGRNLSAALRLLQLPRGTSLALRDRLAAPWEINPATQPPTVVLSDAATDDSLRLRWTLGSVLEATRVGHLPITAFDPEEAERWVSAVAMAFGPPQELRADPAVASLAGRLLDGMPARAQRRMQDLVAELGDRAAYVPWRNAVAQARAFAGLLVSGSFPVAAQELVALSPHAGAAPSTLIATWEPLRELARFAASEEYLLLRWSVDEGARRRR